MREFAKPNVVRSRCLEFETCRHDGERIRDDFVRAHVHFVTVCSENGIGPGVPHPSVHLRER